MGSPVCGLRPVRALRCAFTRRPNPGTTKIPFFFVSLIAVSARFSRNAAAVLLGISTFSARSRISCVLVRPAAILPPQKNRFNTKSRLSYTREPVEKHLFYAVFLTQMCCKAHFYRLFRDRLC